MEAPQETTPSVLQDDTNTSAKSSKPLPTGAGGPGIDWMGDSDHVHRHTQAPEASTPGVHPLPRP